MDTKVKYLGHIIDAQGIHTDVRKDEVICKASSPTNVQQLRSLLGLINYYSKFIPNLASVTKYELLSECDAAFKAIKLQSSSSNVLAHYDSKLPIRLATDASPYRLGAVISHVCTDGSEHSIEFASRTLTSVESNYSQIEKEALSIVEDSTNTYTGVFSLY